MSIYNKFSHENESKEYYYGGHLVAFIDILGQSRQLDSFKKIEWWKLNDNTKAILKETYGKILNFRKIFKENLEGFTKQSELDTIIQKSVDPHQTANWNHFNENRILLKSSSDALILTFPLHIINGFIPLKSIFGVLGACTTGMLASLNYKFAIRGAIEIGPCVFDTECNEVYGSALNDAVKYEKKADWPRIIIGTQFIQYLEQCSNLPNDTKINKLNIALAKKCLSGIEKDTDNYYLSFLSKVFYEDFDNRKYRYLVDNAVTFIEEQLEKYKHNKKIYSKYTKLKNYIQKFDI
jgi:hypothetical protein